MKTGRKASEIYEEQKSGGGQNSSIDNDHMEDTVLRGGAIKYPTVIFWLYSDMETLKQRLADRVDEMVLNGLISEVEQMEEHLHHQTDVGVTVDQTRGIWISIGFKEFEEYLAAKRAGTASDSELERLKQEGIERVKIATRQYAKRQIRWIRVRLWNALKNVRATNRLILLDVTDPACWEEEVAKPAERIVTSFLKGEALPDPTSLSEVARTVLACSPEEAAGGEMYECRFCGTCNKTLQTEKQWKDHLTSKGHKKTLRAPSKPASRPFPDRREGSQGQQTSVHAN
jgi:tRNA dimethylallyltransferase